MKLSVISSLFILLIFIGCDNTDEQAPVSDTICNPLNLSYRFRPETNEPSRREAADPTMIVFKDEYFLFASKTGGYWHSKDLKTWDLIQTSQIPTEDYAPTATVIGDTIYFMASNSSNCPIYKTGNPQSGNWELVTDNFPYAVTDPAFFLDDDERLYLYWGCSNEDPIMGVELDLNNNFQPIGEPDSLIFANTSEFGWENPGDNNELTNQAPWLEGAWMTKNNGLYYLQYSGPGTEYKSYTDAVYISDSPLGNFRPAEHNPMAYKPGGFISGLGHGSVFQDNFGNHWHVGTMSISVKHKFERRIGMVPVFYDKDNNMFARTDWADYPFFIPEKKINSAREIETGWMLLSYSKPTKVSSQIKNHPSVNAVNEDVRSYWSAKSGNPGEWISINLEETYRVYGVQVNFAQEDTKIYGRNSETVHHQFKIEYSTNGKNWKTLIDNSNNQSDTPHAYFSLKQPINAQFIKLTNQHIPGGKFAISGFRIFGKGDGNTPQRVKNFNITRQKDRRSALLQWEDIPDAIGYKINYGINKNKQYLNHIVYDQSELEIRSLNANSSYYFRIEAFNENGVSQSSALKAIK